MSFALIGAVAFTMNTTPAKAYGMAGCGLGSMVIQSNDIMQIFAATTNGTSANQTFGITTGTSGCTGSASAYKEHQQEVFVNVNFNSLKQEMAAGQGEKLDAFSTLLGCSSDVKGTLASHTKENYSKLFSAEATPSSLLKSVKAEIQQNKELASGCQI